MSKAIPIHPKTIYSQNYQTPPTPAGSYGNCMGGHNPFKLQIICIVLYIVIYTCISMIDN